MTHTGEEAAFQSASIMARIMIRGTTIHGTMTVGTMTHGIMIHGITGHIIRIIIGIMTRITAGDGLITGITVHITDIIRIGAGIQEVITMVTIMGMVIIMMTIRIKSFMEDCLQEKETLLHPLMRIIKIYQVTVVQELTQIT